jgi:hypothetical protein
MPSTINAQAGNATQWTALIKTASGTANLSLQTNGSTALLIDQNQNANCTSTGAIKIPAGTTAQRPSPAVNGMVRYNTTNAKLEGYANNSWAVF